MQNKKSLFQFQLSLPLPIIRRGLRALSSALRAATVHS
jgi:hypothetical protein